MTFALFSIVITTGFFASSLILLNFGRHLGLRYLRRAAADSITGFGPVEGAVFALVGLLLAFTISGALQRFDERRQLVVQETNALSAAYDHIGLFEGDVARDLRAKLRDYLHARIELYRASHDFSLWRGAEVWPTQQLDNIRQLKAKLWDATVAACPQTNHPPACALVAPALTNAFEIARLRAGASEKHPPQIIYVMLFGLSLVGSLLAGFGMAAAKARSWVHIVCFATALTVTLYVVTELEFPRIGLIRIENFDSFLINLENQMQAAGGARDLQGQSFPSQ